MNNENEKSQNIKIVNLNNANTLRLMRFNAMDSFKAGILPFFLDGNKTPHFILYAPVPQHDGEHGKILPYQIARGTIRSEYRLNDKTIWIDKGRNKSIPSGAIFMRDETPVEAALREAEEELGMPHNAPDVLYDCGELAYQNPKGVVYKLHMFLSHIKDASKLSHPDPYVCAARLNGITLEQAEELAKLPKEQATFESRPFKDTYLNLLRTLHDTILENCIP
jgi:ADP-ribose pyrophosphatase YjhB (NUDIX family)